MLTNLAIGHYAGTSTFLEMSKKTNYRKSRTGTDKFDYFVTLSARCNAPKGKLAGNTYLSVFRLGVSALPALGHKSSPRSTYLNAFKVYVLQ